MHRAVLLLLLIMFLGLKEKETKLKGDMHVASIDVCPHELFHISTFS
jgi:hypothetical protein